MTITLWSDVERGLTNTEFDNNFIELAAGCIAQSAIDNRPTVKPSLNLDFTKGILDPRITFTRASTATYYGADGLLKTAGVNEPRFEYDPLTRQPKGLLIEEQRTNIQTYSSDFSQNRGWVGTINAAISPDGTLTADLCTTSEIDNYPNGYGSGTGTIRTYSVFVKTNTASSITVSDPINATSASFNFLTKILTGSGGFQELSNGWFRVWVTYTVSNPFGYNRISTVGGSVYLWGEQLETGTFPTSYIPTTSAQVTRMGDIATITGANFSSWYRVDEGTLYFEGFVRESGTSSYENIVLITSSTGTTTGIGFNASSTGANVYLRGPATAMNFTSMPSTPTLVRLAGAYKSNDFAATRAGATPTTSAVGNVPTDLTRLLIGHIDSLYPYNGTVTSIKYYPARLTNTQLQELTK